jgi:hypothetical protein
MSRNSFYKIIASPRHQRNILAKILHNPKKRQVIVSILSIYTLVGSLVAFTMFSRTEKPATAYEPALISAKIELREDKEFVIGDTINVNLTLQNTSSEQSINDVDLELMSTKDVIKWNKVELSNKELSTKNYPIDKNHAKLDLLSSGERSEYTVSGTLSDNQIPLSTVIGKIAFNNQEGSQSFTTNKILVTAKESKAVIKNTLELKSDKNVYKLDEKINLTVVTLGDIAGTDLKDVVGKIYITNKNTKEIVRDDTCTIDETSSCVDSIDGLPVGKYSTIYISKDNKKMSLIGQFEVLGKGGEFQPDTNSTLEFPFGERSINGLVAVYARKVISLNNTVKAGDNCNFEIVRDNKAVASTKAQVDSDGSCHTILSAAQVPDNGIYSIRLAGTNQQKDISIVKKGDKFIQFENKNLVLAKNKPIAFEAKNIISLNTTSPGPLNDTKATIGILHQASGEYQEINNANGEVFKVNNGNFNITLPGQSFLKGGLYSVFMKTEDSQTSDFITISLDDKEIGFSSTNVLVDSPDNLRVGKTIIFKVQGLTDRNGNILTTGECGADVYTTTNPNTHILAKGEIKDGTCSAQLDQDKITQEGPILVSFTGDDITNKINQSRQFTIKPGDVNSYGYLNLEYEPAREGFANNVIIGPVTDIRGNLVNALNKKLVIKSGDQPVKEISAINIQNGFAKISIPGSTLIKGEMTLSLYDNDEANTILTTRIINVTKTEDKLFLPAFPTVINSSEKIKVVMDNLPNADENTECKLTFIRSNVDYFDGTGKYDVEKKQCSVEYDLDTFRTNAAALLRYQVGDFTYSNTVTLESGDATNLFAITPQIQQAAKNEVNVTMLTSPITDKQGKPVANGKVKIQYNGKIEELAIKNGLAKLEVDADKLDTKDISNKLDQKFLELNINSKAGISSISKTNSLSVFLGKKDIATHKTNIKPKFAQNQIEATAPYIFGFDSMICNINIINADNKATPAKSHQQGDICYVEVKADEGDYTLSFEESGFEKYTFDFKATAQTAKINWSDSKPLTVEVIGETRGDEEVIVYDGENQFKFENKENNSGIKVQQNGLNPLKDYTVEVKYQDKDGNNVSHFKTFSGEKLVK